MTLNLPDVDGLEIAVDCESSGLYVDEGARLSIISLAWRSEGEIGSADGIESRVLPFDQGQLDKTNLPKQYGGPGLWGDPVNLDQSEWVDLMWWLGRQRLVFHNSKYDLHQIAAGHRVWGLGVDFSESMHWDTQVICPLVWPLQDTALKPTGERLFGVKERKEEINLKRWLKKNGNRYDLAPWDLIGPYAGQDARLTIRLYEWQTQAIEQGLLGVRSEGFRLADRELDLAVTLFRMEQRGIGFDVEAGQQEDAKLAGMVVSAKQQVQQIIDMRTVSEASMRTFWFSDKPGCLNLEPLAVTDKGQASVTNDVVRELVNRHVKGAVEWQRYTKLDTAYSMWYGRWWRLCGPDGRLRTNYRQTKGQDDEGRWRGTVTGRLAVERVQLQAFPHDYQIPEGLVPIRRFFKPGDGYVLYEFDLSQAEMRSAAGIADCRSLSDAFARGEDAHDSTTRLMFQIDEADSKWKHYRNVSKRLNFGMLYGAGLDRLAEQIRFYTGENVPNHVVEEWLNRYRSVYPELGKASWRAQAMAERVHYVPLAGGRKRWFRHAFYRDGMRIGFDEPTHKAFNAQIQGGVAEMMKDWMIEVEAQYPGILLLQIHDSLVCEIPVDQMDMIGSVAKLGEDVFSEAFGVVFRTDVKEWH